MNKATVNKIFQCLQAQNPAPHTELRYRSPFELLIAVILSAQATDISVNKATAELFKVAPTPAQMLRLGLIGLKSHIKTIGLYNVKANYVIKTCHALIDRHDSKVPCQREALEALPGVGRKTANVVLNTVFGEPTIAVDTHIFRVSKRLGLANGKTVLKVEQQLLRAVPTEFKYAAHHWLILHGRHICKARRPQCPQCPLKDLCAYRYKTLIMPTNA